MAAAKDLDGAPIVREVAILFENYLWRGNRSTKHSADQFNAFKSNNYPELARVGLGIYYNKEALWRRQVPGSLKVHYGMDPNVIYLDLFPGIQESTVKHMLATPVSGESYSKPSGPVTARMTLGSSKLLRRP